MSDDFGLRIVSKGITAEEIAAVSAVVTGALEELAAAQGVESTPRVSAWQATQRPIRRVLTPGAGAWRGFSG